MCKYQEWKRIKTLADIENTIRYFEQPIPVNEKTRWRSQILSNIIYKTHIREIII